MRPFKFISFHHFFCNTILLKIFSTIYYKIWIFILSRLSLNGLLLVTIILT